MGWTKQSYQWISQFRTFNSTHDFYPIQWNSSRNPEIFLQELPIRIAAAARFEFNCLVSLGAFSKWQVHSGDCKGYLIFFYDLLSNEDNELIKLLYKNLFCFVCSKQKYFFIEKSFLLTPVICPYFNYIMWPSWTEGRFRRLIGSKFLTRDLKVTEHMLA